MTGTLEDADSTTTCFGKGEGGVFIYQCTYHLDKSNNTYKHFRTCRAIILKI